MALTIYPYALTTLANLKDRLGIQSAQTGFDNLLIRMINQHTDLIERACGNRQFAGRTAGQLNTYTNEVYDGQTGGRFMVLRQAPVFSLTVFQWRAGVPTNPAWTDFVPTVYELDQLDNNGMCRTGMIRVYGGVPRGSSNLRATYTAGYKVDWANEGQVTHTLPADLTQLCEKLCVRAFQRRASTGKQSESAKEASVSWNSKFDDDDMLVIMEYTRPALYA